MSKIRLMATGMLGLAMGLTSIAGFSATALAESSTSSGANPTLVGIKALNTGGTSIVEAGDSVVLKFSKSTNKAEITATNIVTEFSLNNSHSFMDGAKVLGPTSWSDDGKKLTITLAASLAVPTVSAGDILTITGTAIKDLSGVAFTGTKTIEGSFIAPLSDDDSTSDNEHEKHLCGNTLVNGHLYKIGDSPTVYLVTDCKLKPFRGAAVFKSRGMKFENITTLTELPVGASISDKPVLPTEGTLVKGNDKTVWFVDHNGKRRGFVSSTVFTKLGFKFTSVQQVSQTDLDLIPTDSNVSSETEHPDGALIKCAGSNAVFAVIGGIKFPFASSAAFQERGHAYEQILTVECGRFAYQQGAAITQ